MVLRALATLAFIAGCGQSLFDNNIGGGSNGSGTDGGNGSGDGNTVASSCPSGCIGDAAADIDGSRGGWRYLEDSRNRAWAPMSASGDGFVGAVSPNAIATCAANASAAACAELPGALLVTTAGMSTAADPALEFTSSSTSAQVIQLTVRVHVPAGQSEQKVRLYRNSREDSLFTASAVAGSTFDRAITVDALVGDRFLLALAPTAGGASDVGVHFFANLTGDAFPQACQLAIDFGTVTGNTVGNACGAVATYYDYDLSSPNDEIPPTRAAGPFPELGMAADIPLSEYYIGADVIQRSGDSTTQLWVRHDQFDPSYPYNAFPYSDIDLNNTGGFEVGIYDSGSLVRRLEVYSCDTATQTTFTTVGTNVAYPNDTSWHFIRIVHVNGQVRICVDGTRVGSFVVPAGELQSGFKPRFGKNVVWTPSFASFDGGVDDIRALSVALPCE